MSVHPEDKAEMDRLLADARDDGLVACDHCDGRFDRSDMQGDHCHDCAEELFGDDEGPDA